MADGTDIDEAFVEEETDLTKLIGILADGVVGATAGLVGTAMMTVVLLIAESLNAFSRQAFADLTQLIGLGAYVPPVTFGFLLFLLGGMVPWPLLFASLREYLPGRTWPVSGLFFGTALWTGFALAFYDGAAGVSLALYLVLTLVAHWAYGVSLGLVFSYFSDRPASLI